MDKVGIFLVVLVGVLALLVGVSALLALPVMWLWNALVPDLFHGPVIGYLQAWGLLLLCGLLLKSGSFSNKD